MGARAIELERWAEHLLIRLSDKRIEELEKRLKSMEDLMKRPVSSQQYGFNGIEFGNDSRGPETPPYSNQSENGSSNSSSNLGPSFATTSNTPQASTSGLPSSDGKYESVVYFLL